MRLSSFWPLLPAALGMVTVFYLPSDADRPAVDEVRATIGRVVGTITGALTGGVAAPEPAPVRLTADSSASCNHPAVHYNNSVAPVRGDSTTQQTWENRPTTSNYSNGRNTRLAYGESQRDLPGGRR